MCPPILEGQRWVPSRMKRCIRSRKWRLRHDQSTDDAEHTEQVLEGLTRPACQRCYACDSLELILFLDQLVELVKTVALLLAFVSDHCAHRLTHRRTQRRSRRHEDTTGEDGNGCISDDLRESFNVRHIDVVT